MVNEIKWIEQNGETVVVCVDDKAHATFVARITPRHPGWTYQIEKTDLHGTKSVGGYFLSKDRCVSESELWISLNCQAKASRTKKSQLPDA